MDSLGTRHLPMKCKNLFPVARSLGAIILGYLFVGSDSMAQQEVVAPLPSPVNGVLEQAGIPLAPPSQDPSAIASVVRPESPFQYQPFVLMPHFLYRFLYEYGVLVAPGHPATTLIDTFSPGFALQIGSNWTLDYTADWNVYSNSKFKDYLGHSALVTGKDSFDNWTVLLTQSYVYTAQPLIETGKQTTVQDYKTALDISRDIGEHILIETVLGQELRYAKTFPDTYQWSIDEWLHYRFAREFDAAVGDGAGYIHESQGADSNFTRPETKLSWQPTDKLDISATGGLEDRVYLDYPRTSVTTPTYDLSLQYTPVQTTKIILDLSRQVTPSYQADESSKYTKATLSLTQRLLGKVYFSGSVGYNDVNYISAKATNSTARTDTQTTFNLQLSTEFLSRGTISLFAYRMKNSSSMAGFQFVTNQFGVELGYHY